MLLPFLRNIFFLDMAYVREFSITQIWKHNMAQTDHDKQACSSLKSLEGDTAQPVKRT